MKSRKTIIGCLIIVLVIFSGQTKSFAVTVTTQSATDIQETSAIGHGTIDNISQYWRTRQHGICWNTSGGPVIGKDPKTELGRVSQPTVFTSTMQNLTPGATYYVRAYATQDFFGTTYGTEVSFQTLKKPSVTTLAVTGIGSTTATVEGAISELGIPTPIQHGVCWSTKKNPTIDDTKTKQGSVETEGGFTSRITGLELDKKYYVRAYATNLVGTVYGKQKAFRTLPGVPVISTQAVTNITTTSVTANATLVDIGDPPATQYGVCWDTGSMPDYNPDNCIDKGGAVEDGSFTLQINGLQPGTTYYLRAFASNTTQEYHYGNEVSFVTHELPAVSTQSYSGANTNEVIANGTIESLGNPVPTAHGFCWNIAGSPTIADDCIDLGLPMTLGPFVATLADLLPGTTYFVRAFATNQAGTVYGEDLSFETLDEAAAPRAMITNPPPTLTRQTTYQLNVAGSRTVQYRYSLDDSPWSEPMGIDREISFELTDEGLHWLLVLGKDETGIWQTRQSATLVTWTLDTTPPKAKLPNAPKGTIGPFPAEILIKGNDVVAYRYRLGDDGTWSAIFPASVPITLPKLQDGPHTLTVVGADLASNWQDDDNATIIKWNVDSRVPTALLTNLPDAVTNQTAISIGVAAPEGGVPVKEYYYIFDDSDAWKRADVSQAIIVSWGANGEGEHTLCVNAGNGESVWQDGSDGQSSIDSATCHTWHIDLTPPEPVQLIAEKAPPIYIHEGLSIASRGIKLSWAWQSDDEQEAIQRYRVWQAENEITADNLDGAVELFCESQPGSEGYVESLSVNDLAASKTHYFAVIAVDKAGNTSDLSSVGPLTVVAQVPEIIDVGFKEGGFQTDNASIKTISLSGNNFINTTDSNYIRFENNGTDFLFPATLAAEGKLELQIPMGLPTDIYWVRVVNANGISAPGPEMITIVDAETPLPAVRNISPRMAPIGTPINLTITGDHFKPSAGVSLVAMDGQEYDPVYYDVSVQPDAHTITATVDIPDDFPEGSYDIRVKNAETEFNQFSAVRLELYVPQNLYDASGGVETHKIVQLADGIVPVVTTLKTRDAIFTGATGNQRLKMKIFLMPGFTFEVQSSVQNEALPFHGHLLSPREAEASSLVIDTLGQEAIQFLMGADVLLRLKNSAVMFANLEITLPSHLPAPGVYYLATDGGIELAGVQGTWQGIDIEQGGTILSTRPDTPEAGQTTFSIGLLLDHFSNYAIGSTGSSSFSDLFQIDDAYGPCFINAVR